MKVYRGERTRGGTVVTVDGQLLDLRLDLVNHSPTGFEWGYGGSGPSQLALAILADYLQDDSLAMHLYQEFKWKVVSGITSKKWELKESDVQVVVDKIQTGLEKGNEESSQESA